MPVYYVWPKYAFDLGIYEKHLSGHKWTDERDTIVLLIYELGYAHLQGLWGICEDLLLQLVF
jgi:hypothetical protein